MRLLLTTLAALALAGCQAPAPEPTDNGDTPNEAVVEGELQNEQAEQAEAIQNEAAADNADVDTDD